MVRILCIFTLLLCTAFSCSKEGDELITPTDDMPAIIFDVTAQETATVGENVSIKIDYYLNNACKTFSRLQESKTGNEYDIVVYVKDENRVCHQAVIPTTTTYTFTPAAAGVYTFHFWKDPQNSITKTITVTGDSN